MQRALSKVFMKLLLLIIIILLLGTLAWWLLPTNSFMSSPRCLTGKSWMTVTYTTTCF